MREAERLARSWLGKADSAAGSRRPAPAPGSSARPPAIRDIEERLALALGARVSIQAQSDSAGRIVIPYSSLDDFERIVSALGVETGAE